MKKGFTLLELIVVIIILGVLATLALTQYGRTIERTRGAEARQILGSARKFAAGMYMDIGTTTGLTNLQVGFGAGLDQAPDAVGGCRPSHYFSYALTGNADPAVTLTATRCAAGGKTPQGGPAAGLTLTLDANVQTGIDLWGGTGSY